MRTSPQVELRLSPDLPDLQLTSDKIIEFDKTVEYSRLLFRFDSYTRILYGEFRFFSFYLVTDGYTPFGGKF